MRKRRLLASVLLGTAMFVLPACDDDGDADRNIIEDPRGGNTEGPGEDDAIRETPTDDG